MKQHMRYVWKLLGERVFFNVLTFLMLPVFIPIIGTFSNDRTFTGVGPVIYSVMFCSLYLGIAFDITWKMGRHDQKSYATEKHYALKGLVVGLISEIPFFFFYILLLLFPAMLPFYRNVCVSVYMGFLPAILPAGFSAGLAGYGLVLLILPVFGMLGYMTGFKKPKDAKEKLSYRIMYKKKSQ